MVKRGFTRAYGSSLRLWISRSTKNRFTACASGFVATFLLQSSTAATLLMLSFVKKHGIPLTAALGFVIGADIATTIVAQIFTFDLSWLAPALLIIGIIGYMKNDHGGRKKHIFSIFIGIGLMLLSLSLVREATEPLKTSETLPLIIGPLQSDPIMAILFAALLTWIVHSSLAVILLLGAFAAGGIIDMQLGLLMVLGVNIGGALTAFAATYKEGPEARQVTSGNILMRTLTAAAAYLFMADILAHMQTLNLAPARALVTLHVAFNIALGITFLPLVSFIAKASQTIMPKPKDPPREESDPIYLEDAALETPTIALTLAARETTRMAEMVEEMLRDTIECFKENTDILAEHISERDDCIDRLYAAIKLYLAKLTQESLDPKEADRYLQILTFATNLEHAGDIIEKSLMELARKKINKKERFSEEGWAEIKAFHAKILDNMKLSQNLFLSEDPALAQQLIDNKNEVRKAESHTSTQHFKRLQAGLPETIATSALHLDIIRDYRRINSYITAVAYQIIETSARNANKRKR